MGKAMRESAASDARWVKAATREQLREKPVVFRPGGGKQIALFETADGGLHACDNRCPHEGYPLAEGALDGGCILTCNWHNWKFDLASGANLLGGDRLRVYPVDERGGEVWVDIADPPVEERRAAIMASLREAFDDHEYDRIAREIARYGQTGADPCDVLVEAIGWSHDRLEFGWTHAYAGAADWLGLHDEHADDPEKRLICLLEAVGHMAWDVLREPRYPFNRESRPFDEEAFVAAIEAEDEAAAAAMLRGGLAAGLHFADMERAFSRAALAHYNGFGHSLIYVVKAGRLIGRLGDAVETPLLLALLRSIVLATREDRIPEFSDYADALAGWGRKPNGETPEAAAFAGLNVDNALALASEHGAAPAEALYGALLEANARNMLAFDLAWQRQVDKQVRDNVGWLDFTHAITFGNAVRRQCSRFPGLWPAGLLQLACFAGRNAAYTDAALDGEKWRVDDGEAFLAGAVEGLFDHGRDEYIVSIHFVKTVLAAREEVRAGVGKGAAEAMLAALNRLVNSPLKRKHVRRTARQAMSFVALDG